MPRSRLQIKWHLLALLLQSMHVSCTHVVIHGMGLWHRPAMPPTCSPDPKSNAKRYEEGGRAQILSCTPRWIQALFPVSPQGDECTLNDYNVKPGSTDGHSADLLARTYLLATASAFGLCRPRVEGLWECLQGLSVMLEIWINYLSRSVRSMLYLHISIYIYMWGSCGDVKTPSKSSKPLHKFAGGVGVDKSQPRVEILRA